MGEVRSLQSQVHKVRGRSASGERMILPLSSMSEVLGRKNSSTFSKMIRNSSSFHASSLSIKEALRTQTTSTFVGTMWNQTPSGPGAESFFKATRSSNSVLSIVQRMFSNGCASSSVRALRDSTGFLLRHVCCPLLHLARALSFSVRNDLAEPPEINTFKGNRINAIFNRLPCLTTSHECPKMSVSVGTHSSRGD